MQQQKQQYTTWNNLILSDILLTLQLTMYSLNLVDGYGLIYQFKNQFNTDSIYKKNINTRQMMQQCSMF